MDEIQKLREKVEKDPKSTVFVRLAEELKKTGELDEAIEVLKSGIERQPGYTSARVALGKIYHEKGMEAEAKAEFMQVIETVPDNLYARKKLAEIYRAEGDNDLSLQQYRAYLALSPMDEEVQAICKELESAPPRAAKPEEEAKAVEGEEEEGLDVEGVYLEGAVAEEEEASGFVASLDEEDAYAGAGAYSLQDQETVEIGGEEDFSLSLQDKETPAREAGEEELSLSLQEKEDIGTGGADEVVSQDDIDAMIEEVAGVPEEEEATIAIPAEAPPAPEPVEAAPEFAENVEMVPEAPEAFELEGVMEEEGVEAIGVVEIEDEGEIAVELEGVVEEVGEEPVGVVEIEEEVPREEPEYGVDLGAPAPEKPTAPEVKAAPLLEESFREADTLVAKEDYIQAMDIYRGLLARDPENGEVRQRAEELRGLLKLLGKDKEMIEARLNAFLDALKRKQHEFFGSS